MADAPPFERGDIVVYMHKDAPPEGRGSIAIVEEVGTFIAVQWISVSAYLSGEAGATSGGWDACSFEKVGHIDLPTR